ncbi:MAG: polyprenyl synthetase family protein [Candidatus Heimdallarchaeota archaeon]|nr:MAG: polyprenyl synthetase family protein [Candidatus Heimdallarchaeota archaeon]
MKDLSLNDVFIHMSDLGKAVEPRMKEFLLKEVHPEFEELVTWQINAGGKRIRPALTLLFAQAFGAASDDPEALAAAAGIELIHNYSLILDDIIDRGNVRRDKPTVRARYGDEFAILAGIIYRESVFEAAKACGKYVNDTISIYSETIRKLVEGERLDILFEQNDQRTHEYFRTHRYSDITLEDYQSMIAGKTASLLAASCKLGVLVGGASFDDQTSAEKFGWTVGIAFQIVDDYLDIFATSGKFGKEVYKDIIEQKLGNYVVVRAIKNLEEDEARLLREYLRDPNLSDKDRVGKCVPLIEKSNVKEIVIEEAEKWADEAKTILSSIDFKNEEVRGILEKVVDFTVRRAF